jgi:hypothetical protein
VRPHDLPVAGCSLVCEEVCDAHPAHPGRRERRPGDRPARPGRGAQAVREGPAHPVGELRVGGRARGVGQRADQQVLRGLPWPPLLRGPAVHRSGRDDRQGPRAGAVRRGPRQRAAVFGLAREPRGLPGLRPAGRHGDGHGAADGRPPHPRLVGFRHRQVVPAGPVRGPLRHRPGRHGRGTRPGPQGAAQDHLLRRNGDPADDRLPGLRRHRRRGGLDPGGRHRAHRRPDRPRRCAGRAAP